MYEDFELNAMTGAQGSAGESGEGEASDEITMEASQTDALVETAEVAAEPVQRVLSEAAPRTAYGYRGAAETNRVSLSHIPEEPVKKPKKKGGIFKKLLICAAFGIVFGVFFGAAIVGVKYITDKVDVSFSSDFKVGKDKDSKASEIIEDAQDIFEEVLPDIKGDDEDIAPSREKEIEAPKNHGPEDYEVQVGPMDVSGVVEKCMPSIVAITNKYTERYQSIWGQIGEVQNEASGSGIIVGENEEELLVVTNSHVISDADELTVQFVDGESYDAEVKGSNTNEDIAIIAIKLTDMSDDTLSEISIASLGDSDSLKVGEPAIAIGNSMGYGQSVTCGIISALNRDFQYENASKKVIQTDAAINPGNSGGALLNIRGEVIGINEAKLSSTSVEGVGYAIPISIAKPIIDNLVTKTTRSKVDEGDAAFLGIGGVDVTDSVASMYAMPMGVYINQVAEGSAAESAGLMKGDIITTFDGETVSSMEELKKVIEYYAAGTEVEIEIQRLGDDGYEELTIPVILGKKEN